MSLLWTKLRARLGLRSVAGIGISLGRTGLCAARLGADTHTTWVRRVNFPITLFNGAPTPEARKALIDAFGQLRNEIKDYAPIQISLPDPLFTMAVFALETLPKTKKTRLALVRWRFAKELHLPESGIECVCQYVGEDNGKHLLLGLAVDKAWLQCIQEACAQARLIAGVVDMEACHRFNYFYPILTADRKDGALICIEPEHWTLSMWDAQGRLRFARSRWRERNDVFGAVAEFDAIAAEIERSIRAYVRPGSARAIGRVYVTGADEPGRQLSVCLNERMREQCTWLSARTSEGAPPAREQGPLLDAAIAAAVCR